MPKIVDVPGNLLVFSKIQFVVNIKKMKGAYGDIEKFSKNLQANLNPFMEVKRYPWAKQSRIALRLFNNH